MPPGRSVAHYGCKFQKIVAYVISRLRRAFATASDLKSFHNVTFLLLFLVATASNSASCIVESARNQIGVTATYDPTYVRLRYPGGDVLLDRGVCTDVLIRAYRACGADLQVLVHEDMKTAWAKYPKLWNQTGPDSNIDHRRVPNLAVFFARHGETLSTAQNPSAYKPADIVTWKLPSGVPHIGFVSDHKNDNGIPLVIHNIGAGAREKDELFLYKITGHFRFVPQRP
jgi:uncharacterized protein